ncbi:MAG: FliH/SctL family protein [Hydrogenophaga sp.]|nr:FliH/SctL family protein [Hydrogenophaga sp.]
MTASSKPATKSNPHSRFIPREEIGDVSAWTFNSMDVSEDVTEPAPEPEPVGVDEHTLHEAREAAYAEGFAQGHETGSQETRDALEATVRKTAEETAVRMAQLLHNTREHLTRSEDQISRHILELACDLARQVVRQELAGNTQHLKPVIAEALSQLVDDGLPATVRMHPADLALMKGALQETLASPKPEFVADASISPGGCIVESASMAVDATIEKRWARAVGNLGLDAAWNPENADV